MVAKTKSWRGLLERQSGVCEGTNCRPRQLCLYSNRLQVNYILKWLHNYWTHHTQGSLHPLWVQTRQAPMSQFWSQSLRTTNKYRGGIKSIYERISNRAPILRWAWWGSRQRIVTGTKPTCSSIQVTSYHQWGIQVVRSYSGQRRQ